LFQQECINIQEKQTIRAYYLKKKCFPAVLKHESMTETWVDKELVFNKLKDK
jgi:hypothetical protein